MNWWLEKDDFTEVERCPDPAGCRYNLSEAGKRGYFEPLFLKETTRNDVGASPV